MSIFNGLVLESYDFKDNDVIIKCLTAKGLISIMCRGVKKYKSKNKAAVLPYSYSSFEVLDSRTNMFLLKSANLIKSNYQDDLTVLSVLSIFSEIILADPYDSNYYEILLYTMKFLDKPFLAASYFLKSSLEIHGLQPIINHCVYCGSKKFVNISIKDGGMLCINHSENNTDISRLKKFYLINKASFNLELINLEYDYVDLKLFIDYYEYHLNSKIKSFQLLTI